MPKVGIVISNYNGWQDTLVCLDSLQKQTFTDFEVILIDDASPNDSVAQLQNKLPPNTVFLPQERNVGFAAANNIGMRRALDDGCEFALLLNNDTSVRPDFLEKLLAETAARAEARNIALNVAPETATLLAAQCLDDASGARALRHRIQSAVEDPLAGLMLADSTLTAASVSVESGAIAVRPGASK